MKETLVSIDGESRAHPIAKNDDTPSFQKRGFKKKGKLLVFSTAGAETLNNTVVSVLLNEIRNEKLNSINQHTARRQE